MDKEQLSQALAKTETRTAALAEELSVERALIRGARVELQAARQECQRYKEEIESLQRELAEQANELAAQRRVAEHSQQCLDEFFSVDEAETQG